MYLARRTNLELFSRLGTGESCCSCQAICRRCTSFSYDLCSRCANSARKEMMQAMRNAGSVRDGRIDDGNMVSYLPTANSINIQNHIQARFRFLDSLLSKLLNAPPNTLPRTMVTAMVNATRPKVQDRMIFFRRLMRTFHSITTGKQITTDS